MKFILSAVVVALVVASFSFKTAAAGTAVVKQAHSRIEVAEAAALR